MVALSFCTVPWSFPFACARTAPGLACGGGPHWAGVTSANGGEDAVVHMFHGELWGGWQYAVDSVVNHGGGNVTIAFGYGGYQVGPLS